ncbi:MAG: hypothetical protein SFW09_21550 [Hyphomicrobiaceae bacterium]|nr:hypothetical protein [Hyphomicrobiaceae bacterium]
MSVRQQRRIPRVVSFLAINAVAGAIAGVLAAAGILVTDAGGLMSLAAQSGSTVTASSMLIGGFALTFGSLAMGSAVMLLPRQD